MVVGDGNQGCLLGFDVIKENIEDPVLVGGIEVASGFVGKEDLGLGKQGAADGDTLFFTLGKGFYRSLELIGNPQLVG